MSEKTINNTAYLCAELCKYIGITADTVDIFVLRHYDVWDKQCPAQWATNNSEGWIAFKEKVKSILRNEEGLTVSQYEELLSKINELDNKKADKSEMIYDCIDIICQSGRISLFSGVWIMVLYQVQMTHILI